MQRTEGRRQKSVDAGHEWQARHSRQIGARSGHIAQRDEKGGNWKRPGISHAVHSPCDGLYQALQAAHFRGRDSNQNADRSDDVAKRHRKTCQKQRPRQSASRILDFFPHEGTGFASAKSKNQQ